MRHKIYLDSGADISKIKDLKRYCHFITFPYDDRSNKRGKLAVPSLATWEDMNITWDESCFTWDDFGESRIYTQIEALIGKANRRDILHVDSAYKSKADIFLTHDKDILNNKTELERICQFKIFNPDSDSESLREFILKKFAV